MPGSSLLRPARASRLRPQLLTGPRGKTLAVMSTEIPYQPELGGKGTRVSTQAGCRAGQDIVSDVVLLKAGTPTAVQDDMSTRISTIVQLEADTDSKEVCSVADAQRCAREHRSLHAQLLSAILATYQRILLSLTVSCPSYRCRSLGVHA